MVLALTLENLVLVLVLRAGAWRRVKTEFVRILINEVDNKDVENQDYFDPTPNKVAERK